MLIYHRFPGNGRKSGLTLIELLVVLLIISVLTGSALVYMNTDAHRLRAEANNLKSTLEEARAEAVKRNEKVHVVLDDDTYQVRLPNQGDEVLSTVNLPEGVFLISTNDDENNNDLDDHLDSYTVSLQPLGTSHNRHFRITNNSQYYKIGVYTAGRIYIEGPE